MKDFSERVYNEVMKGRNVSLKSAYKAFNYFKSECEEFNDEDIPQGNLDGQFLHSMEALIGIGNYIVFHTNDRDTERYVKSIEERKRKFDEKIDNILGL